MGVNKIKPLRISLVVKNILAISSGMVISRIIFDKKIPEDNKKLLLQYYSTYYLDSDKLPLKTKNIELLKKRLNKLKENHDLTKVFKKVIKRDNYHIVEEFINDREEIWYQPVPYTKEELGKYIINAIGNPKDKDKSNKKVVYLDDMLTSLLYGYPYTIFTAKSNAGEKLANYNRQQKKYQEAKKNIGKKYITQDEIDKLNEEYLDSICTSVPIKRKYK